MAHVTYTVFILPAMSRERGEKYRHQFEDIFEKEQGWRPKPVDESPTPGKGWGNDVYVIGVNYSSGLPSRLAEAEWPPGTVLWQQWEQDAPENVRVHRFGAPTAHDLDPAAWANR